MIVGPKLKLNSQYEPTPTSNGKLATFNFEFPRKCKLEASGEVYQLDFVLQAVDCFNFRNLPLNISKPKQK